MTKNQNVGHGHVYPRADGVRARCGGPGICAECSRDAARKIQETAGAVPLKKKRVRSRSARDSQIKTCADNARLLREAKQVRADRDALISAWERVLGERSEREARTYIEGLKTLIRDWWARTGEFRTPLAVRSTELGIETPPNVAAHEKAWPK